MILTLIISQLSKDVGIQTRLSVAENCHNLVGENILKLYFQYFAHCSNKKKKVLGEIRVWWKFYIKGNAFFS